MHLQYYNLCVITTILYIAYTFYLFLLPLPHIFKITYHVWTVIHTLPKKVHEKYNIANIKCSKWVLI